MKFGIIVTTDCAIWGGEEGVGEYIFKRFDERNLVRDQFVIIRAVTGDLPNEEEIKTFDGFVISGSLNSVNDDLPWISRLEDFIRTVYATAVKLGKPRMVGICFGHQLIAKALGGKVGRNPDENFNYGSCEVNANEDFFNEEFTKKHFEGRSSINIIKFHCEQVIVKPNSARLIGSSQQCKHEILMYGDYILSTQGHPEMTKNMMSGINLAVLKSIGIDIFPLQESIGAIIDHDLDNCVEMVRSFLRSNRRHQIEV